MVLLIMDPISPHRLRLPRSATELAGQKKSGPPRHRPGERFLLGPVPWAWVQRAAQLPGKPLHVGIALYQRAGMEKSDTVKLSNGVLEDMGVDRYAKRRALKDLEKAGLVSVKRRHGRSPVVTILDVPADQ